MISLSAKKREKQNLNALRLQSQVPGVVYGPGVKNISVQVDAKDFRKVFKEAGESSLIELLIDGEAEKKLVLLNEIQRDPLTGQVMHVDFFAASLKEKVEAAIPLVFEGVAPAEKDLGGTLMKNIQELDVKALPQDLPKEIVVNIGSLATFEDHILVKDLSLPANVEVLKEPDEIVASVLAPQDVDAELAQEITEDVSKVETVEKKEKEEVEVPAEEAKDQA